MAKAISAEHLAAQQSANRKPYTEIIFTSKDELTTHDYSQDPTVTTNRFIHLEYTQIVYDDYAIIVLKNEDLSIPDLRGFYVDLGVGYNTTDQGGSGNESVASPRLWVWEQQHVTAPGQQLVILQLEGIWRRMFRKLVDVEEEASLRGALPELWNVEVDSNVRAGLPGIWKAYIGFIYIILEYLIETVYGLTLLPLGDQDDEITVRSLHQFDVNVSAFDYMGSMVMRLMAMTKSLLRAKAGLEFEVRYPQEDDAVDVTFYSDQIPEFLEYTEKLSVLLPNRVIVLANYVEPTLEQLLADPTLTGWENIIISDSGSEDDAVNEIGTNEEEVLEIQIAEGIRTQTDADDLRDAIIQKAKAQTVSGRAIVHNDSRLEILDRAEFRDNRSA